MDHHRTIKTIITHEFFYLEARCSAQPVSKKLVLTFAKMAILNSRAIDFLVTLHFLKFFVREDSQQGLCDI